MPPGKFEELREKYPVFAYEDFHVSQDDRFIRLSFDFRIERLCVFAPEIKIRKTNLSFVNTFDSPTARELVFNLGLAELVSYWKAACPKTVKIRCGALTENGLAFWKKLWFRGLSEFFYVNGIQTEPDSFMSVECEGSAGGGDAGAYVSRGLNLIPVGGGKDSAVTAELLRPFGGKNKFFTVNDQRARTETVLAAGYEEKDIVRTFRAIDPELLRLNREGFLNGHTPFSSVVAFLSLYCAYLIGGEYIVLSNESSANEVSVAGTAVNHQYSKSYEFERDFARYVRENALGDIRYFSLLRPFSELQIARMFSQLPQYHRTFRSCNLGGRENRWCGKCAKCLFVYCILAPFLPEKTMTDIFGADLLDDGQLAEILDGLAGFSPVKPFECVGTAAELRFALRRLARRYIGEKREMPCLLRSFWERTGKEGESGNLLNEYDAENDVPEKFLFAVKEMYERVAEHS